MTSTFVPAGSDFDRADQNILVYDRDRDAGLDPAPLAPPAETLRAAIESADLTDRIYQAWTTPLDCDDDDD
ncbi:hypothetical protein [Nocardia stercoris]|uniref:Uncharacterized protein n=1 Tax=Nocardia stercoris TaxID=2483361 RepID=A0A3M2LD56_9NOCA|nr:hypothetical protein [Nocardia stercoris]RMI35467.1 hypothetical protein EBN03_04210 [Nocardia stercoris]